MDGRRSTDDLIRDLWQWAFGNGRPGVEQRVKELEDAQRDNFTRMDARDLECKIDKLHKMLNIHEVLKLVLIAGAVLALLKGGI